MAPNYLIEEVDDSSDGTLKDVYFVAAADVRTALCCPSRMVEKQRRVEHFRAGIVDNVHKTKIIALPSFFLFRDWLPIKKWAHSLKRKLPPL